MTSFSINYSLKGYLSAFKLFFVKEKMSTICELDGKAFQFDELLHLLVWGLSTDHWTKHPRHFQGSECWRSSQATFPE